MKHPSDKAMEWIAEVDYIHSINPKNPGKTFNHDPGCFARYCNMQANQAKKDGFILIAKEILQSRDIAFPDYRTQARREGKQIIDGSFILFNH